MDRVIIKQRQQKAQSGKEMAPFLRFKKSTKSTSQVQQSKKVESMRKKNWTQNTIGSTVKHEDLTKVHSTGQIVQLCLLFMWAFHVRYTWLLMGACLPSGKKCAGIVAQKKKIFKITSPFWKTGPACSFRTENQAELSALQTGFRLPCSIRKTHWLRCQILSGRIKKYKWS